MRTALLVRPLGHDMIVISASPAVSGQCTSCGVEGTRVLVDSHKEMEVFYQNMLNANVVLCRYS